MRFNKLDLNLLVALDALLAERSIKRAAERVHLSQSAMSNALARLREYFVAAQRRRGPAVELVVATRHAQPVPSLGYAQAFGDGACRAKPQPLAHVRKVHRGPGPGDRGTVVPLGAVVGPG